MKAVTTKGELYIEFNHVRPSVGTGKLDDRTQPGVFLNQGDAGTYCTLKLGGRDGDIIAQGHAIIHPLDVNSFNKEKGRKVALGKALNNLFPRGLQRNKEDRSAVWYAYHNRGLPEHPVATDPNAPRNQPVNQSPL